MEILTQLLEQKALLFDLSLVAVVLLFAILGARRGMILSLCSLVSVILGLAGGAVVSNYLAPPLAQQLAPMLGDLLEEPIHNLLLSGTAALEQADSFLAQAVLNVLENQTDLPQTVLLPPEFISAVTEAILRPILFVIAFVLVLILWHFISHALDLVARLPVLSLLNAVGGFVVGIVKGILFLILVYLLIRTFRPDLIPPEILADSRILSCIQKAPSFL